MFFKNVSMLGSVILLALNGPGGDSIDASHR
jgi:uncharacterized membrane protein YphA (DoxX/SURF4 family)